MENIKILYIDDNTDPYISEYLCDKYNYPDIIIDYLEHSFKQKDSYNTLLNNTNLHLADIVIIDSWLFENDKLLNKKLTGEEFEIILKKVFPFKEVIVVSQNEIDEDIIIIKKYDSSLKETEDDFFEKNWKPVLDKAIEKIKLYRKILKRMEEKNYVEKYFLEGIQQSLLGEAKYNELTVADIDNLITIFESVKEEYDD